MLPLLVALADRPLDCIEQRWTVYRFPEECYCPCLPRPVSRVSILVGGDNEEWNGVAGFKDDAWVSQWQYKF